MSREPVFVGSPTDIATGDAALQRLAEINDQEFETEDGVLLVSEARWQKAQAYERATWIDQNQGSIDDRSNDHRTGFADYAALPKSLGKCIEFGCGPFTQLRNILTDHTADSITLIDPLAKVYQAEHKHCSYKNGQLDGKPVTVLAVPVEDFVADGSFDTVIFINVLSHCRDAAKVLEVVWSSLKPGGVLVFEEQIQERGADRRYDVGHPLTVRKNVLNAFLTRFEGIVETSEGYSIATKGGKVEVEPEHEPVPEPAVRVSIPVVGFTVSETIVFDPIPVSDFAVDDTVISDLIPRNYNEAIEPTIDPTPDMGDDAAVSSAEPPKKRGRKKKNA